MSTQVQLPETYLDMGNGSDILATLTIDQSVEWTIAIVIASMMVMVTLPATITRVAMLDLYCLVVNMKEMEMGRKAALENGSASLREEVASARIGQGPRTGLSICCGVLGMMMVSLVILGLLGGLFFGIP